MVRGGDVGWWNDSDGGVVYMRRMTGSMIMNGMEAKTKVHR